MDSTDSQALPGLSATCRTPGIQLKPTSDKVAVAGLGGLGSHVAVCLARCGIGCLRLIDFDRVEASNIHRQYYFPRQMGRYKVEALKEILLEINPRLEIETVNARLTAATIPEILQNCPVIVEALDRPESKAELVTAALTTFPEAKVVCASGLAGLGDTGTIVSRRIGQRLFVCGDGVSEVGEDFGLMGPRVMVCAGHQANLVLRILCGLEG